MNLVQQLEARGFTQWGTGGRCVAMVRQRQGATDVVTDTGGTELPADADWMLCTYGYDWTSDPGRDQPIDSLDSEVSPVHLLAAVEFANATGKDSK